MASRNCGSGIVLDDLDVPDKRTIAVGGVCGVRLCSVAACCDFTAAKDSMTSFQSPSAEMFGPLFHWPVDLHSQPTQNSTIPVGMFDLEPDRPLHYFRIPIGTQKAFC